MATPLVSVLIPTRARLPFLHRTLRSFVDHARDPGCVEFVLRLHHDDRESVEWWQAYSAKGCEPIPVRVLIGDTDEGYLSYEHWNNSMAAIAKGQWLWMGADDLCVETDDWDTLVAERDPAKPEYLYANVVNWPNGRVPIISRALYDVLGHFGRSPCPDTYLDALANFAGIKVNSRIRVGDQDAAQSLSRDRQGCWDRYRSPAVAALFTLDKRKLGAVLGRDLGRWTTSDAPPKL